MMSTFATVDPAPPSEDETLAGVNHGRYRLSDRIAPTAHTEAVARIHRRLPQEDIETTATISAPRLETDTADAAATKHATASGCRRRKASDATAAAPRTRSITSTTPMRSSFVPAARSG